MLHRRVMPCKPLTARGELGAVLKSFWRRREKGLSLFLR